MDGAVTRLPGTGEGVARLVEVSMVKVDMARLSNDRAITPPVLRLRGRNEWNLAARHASEQQVRWPCARVNELECSMIDRHLVGDISLAILLALPFAAVVTPLATLHRPAATHAAAALSVASAVPASGRISLLG